MGNVPNGTDNRVIAMALCAALLSASSPAAGAPAKVVNWTHISSSTGDLPVPPPNTGQSGFRVVDLDKNGQNDYVITLWGTTETMVWYRHVGSTFQKYLIDTGGADLSHGERFEDIDRDGDLDLIFGDASAGNKMYWWENPYPNYTPSTPWTRRIVRPGPEAMSAATPTFSSSGTAMKRCNIVGSSSSGVTAVW